MSASANGGYTQGSSPPTTPSRLLGHEMAACDWLDLDRTSNQYWQRRLVEVLGASLFSTLRGMLWLWLCVVKRI